MRNEILTVALCVLGVTATAQEQVRSLIRPGNEPIAEGKFQPTWKSLEQFEVPEWFRNAKFGIWAHWGPQCQPGQGDWYARMMYSQGSPQYNWHVKNYGHPSKAGFKDVIYSWKADKWDPEKLVALYKRTGAQYFFALANHHDNLDLWNSRYQQWNSTRVGPQKDIIAGWAAAAKKNNLPFGLSVHASHAWSWYETSQQSDKEGPMAGVPYDGTLTAAEGKGKWWEGLNPDELYAQNHALSEGNEDVRSLFRQWEWGNGTTTPSKEYCEKFYNRTVDLINQFHPDLLYFDDTGLPLYPISDAGLRIAAHFYNDNALRHEGKLQGVLFGKVLNEWQKKSLVWDVERGAPDKGQDLPWQTDTCIGEWHYKNSIYDENKYKTAADVIHLLVDIVSKNGNLLLNIPLKGDGSMDDKEALILNGIAVWMDVNKESIFDTRPWKIFGEGPAADAANPINAQGFNEGKVKFSGKDLRFNQKGDVIYVTALGVPDSQVTVKNLSLSKEPTTISKIELLGSKEKIKWKRSDEGLVIEKPANAPNNIALVFKVYTKKK